MIDHFIHKFNKLKDKEITGISPEAMKILMNLDYLGNVRELENIIEHVFALSSESIIRPDHLPAEINVSDRRSAKQKPGSFDEIERQYILEALKRNNWHRNKTAVELGINKSTLYRKMQKYEIESPKMDGRSRISRSN